MYRIVIAIFRPGGPILVAFVSWWTVACRRSLRAYILEGECRLPHSGSWPMPHSAGSSLTFISFLDFDPFSWIHLSLEEAGQRQWLGEKNAPSLRWPPPTPITGLPDLLSTRCNVATPVEGARYSVLTLIGAAFRVWWREVR